MRYVVSFLSLLAISAVASATEVPGSLSYGGVLNDPSGNPIELNPVVFTVEVITADGNECALYEETHSLDMTGTGGNFNLQLGSGSRSGVAFEDTSALKDIVANNPGLLSGLTCNAGSTYNPASGDSRFVRITVDDGSNIETLSPNIAMNSVANALVANSLQGKAPSDFIHVDTTAGKSLDQASLASVFDSPASVTELVALIAGTSSQYAASGGSGDITDVTAGNGLIGGGVTGAVTLDLNVDDSSVEVVADTLQVKAAGITGAHLAAGSVTAANIAPSSIGLAQMAPNAVDSSIITDGSIVAADLAPGVVTAASLANGSVSTAKLANDAVDSLKILDASITDIDVNAGAAIAWSKINKAGATAADVNALPDTRAVFTVADSGLSGGGVLNTDRSLGVDINGTTVESLNDDNDSILIYDQSAGQLRKQTRLNFLSGVGGASPWVDIASDISYTAGHVGIGTASPVEDFTLHGEMALFQAAGGFSGHSGYTTIKADTDGRIYYKDQTGPTREIATKSVGLNFKDIDLMNNILVGIVGEETELSVRYTENGVANNFFNPSFVNAGPSSNYEVTGGETPVLTNRDSIGLTGGNVVLKASAPTAVPGVEQIIFQDNTTESAYWNQVFTGNFEMSFIVNITTGNSQFRFGFFPTVATGSFNGASAQAGFQNVTDTLMISNSNSEKSDGAMFMPFGPGLVMNNGDIINVSREGDHIKITSSGGGHIEQQWITSDVHFWAGADNVSAFTGLQLNSIRTPSLTNGHDMIVESSAFNNSNVGDAQKGRIMFIVSAPNSPVSPADFIASVKEGAGAFRNATLQSRKVSDVLWVYFGTADLSADSGDGNLYWKIQTVGGPGTKLINIYSVSVEVEN